MSLFTTERLIFRAPVEADRDHYIKLWAEFNFHEMGSNEFPKPQGKKWIDAMLEKTREMAFHATIVSKETGDFLGDIQTNSANRKNRDAKLGVVITEEQRNKGYGGEAIKYVIDLMFRSFGMHRMSLSVYEANIGAIALYKRLGFIEEWRKRKSNWVDGRWQDVIGMSLLEEEWVARQVAQSSIPTKATKRDVMIIPASPSELER